MNKFANKVDRLISQILNEEIENKVNKIVEEFQEGEWKEIEVGEELHGGQKKLDKNKNGKIDAEDFKLLRKKKKESHESEEEEGEHNESWGTVARIAAPMVASYISNKMSDMDESEEGETEEGNEFTGALAKAREEGDDTFEVDGKTYHVKEEKKEKKWIQKTEMKKGALHKKLGVPEGEKIPKSELNKLKKELEKKAEGDKKLSASDMKLLKQVNLALTLGKLKEEKNSLKLTEDELIDMIEKIVLEQKKDDKKNKTNIDKKSPEGLKKTVKVQDQSKKENEDYAQQVVKKMKNYLKDSSKGEFTENPKDFPQNNYTLDKMKEKTKKYHPSDAVEEYIENFAYPGLENTKYDEIKPNEKWLEDNLVGSSRTGNNPEWANAVKTDVGEKVNNKRKKNAYQKEKERSYKRVTQPVDEAGEGEGESSLDKMFNQLESTDKKTKVINEEMNKMKNLITYNRKTQ